jgi:peptidoglycan/xylan/chitin deacetylase (PgdA/CDA1 family)
VTDERLWHPGADPDAETQAVTPRVPHQAEAPEPAEPLAETALYAGPVEAQRRPGSGRATRRRVLFAVGGMTLLGAGGVATAYAVDGPGSTWLRPSASGSASASPTAGRTKSAVPGQGRPTHPSGATSGAPSQQGTASSSPGSPSAGGSTASSPALPPGVKVPTAPEWYVDDAGPMGIALTMDDGPHPVYTPQVLEILEKHGVKATFNMIGRQIGANLSLVREVSAAGHTITNHTWDHADLTHYTFAHVCSEIDRCNDALADANQHPTIFRAPYGNWSKSVFQACAARDLRPVGWSVDPRDWDTAHVDTQQIVQNVLHHTHPHSIILEHDGGGVRSNTVAALKIFIPALLEKGYHFVAM